MATATRRGKAKPAPATPPGEVLTLAEAAAYLRLSEDAVLEAVRQQRLPARKVRSDWRFLKSAIQEWLRGGTNADFWNTHVGALKDDPYLDQMLKQIYKQRGRPMTSDG